MTDDRMTFGHTYRVVQTRTGKHHIVIEDGDTWPSICGRIHVRAGKPASMSLHRAERHALLCGSCVQSAKARGLWTVV